jgi:hypothetical protein
MEAGFVHRLGVSKNVLLADEVIQSSYHEVVNLSAVAVSEYKKKASLAQRFFHRACKASTHNKNTTEAPSTAWIPHQLKGPESSTQRRNA